MFAKTIGSRESWDRVHKATEQPGPEERKINLDKGFICTLDEMFTQLHLASCSCNKSVDSLTLLWHSHHWPGQEGEEADDSVIIFIFAAFEESLN